MADDIKPGDRFKFCEVLYKDSRAFDNAYYDIYDNELTDEERRCINVYEHVCEVEAERGIAPRYLYNDLYEKGKRIHKDIRATVYRQHPGLKHANYWCLCDCGNEFLARGDNLKRGATVSCGKCRRITRGKRSCEDYELYLEEGDW